MLAQPFFKIESAHHNKTAVAQRELNLLLSIDHLLCIYVFHFSLLIYPLIYYF